MTGETMTLDIARRTGVAEGVRGSVPRLYSIQLWRQDDELPDTFGRAIHWITQRTVDYRPARVIIEKPLPTHRGKSNATNVVLLGLHGALAGLMRCRGVPVYYVAASTVRKHFIGAGNLPGDEAKARCMHRCKQLHWDCPDLDAADAAALWDWATRTLP